MALREWFDNRRQLPRRNAVSIFLDLEDRFALLVRGRQTNATFLLRKLYGIQDLVQQDLLERKFVRTYRRKAYRHIAL